MTTSPKILVFAGSAREGSYNKKLAKVAAKALEECGASVTFADLRDYPMPLFDEDLEARDGEHPNATAFKTLMKTHDGFVIVSPEHNSTYSALLKNTLDWASRKRPGEARFECFAGKVTTIMSASPGFLGGLRGLLSLRALLSNIEMLVLPTQLTLPSADKAFNEDGALKDADKTATIKKMMAAMVEMMRKIKAV
jgi:chromate reductase, NAD(P)H dehydrogenase (quinone)